MFHKVGAWNRSPIAGFAPCNFLVEKICMPDLVRVKIISYLRFALRALELERTSVSSSKGREILFHNWSFNLCLSLKKARRATPGTVSSLCFLLRLLSAQLLSWGLVQPPWHEINVGLTAGHRSRVAGQGPEAATPYVLPSPFPLSVNRLQPLELRGHVMHSYPWHKLLWKGRPVSLVWFRYS